MGNAPVPRRSSLTRSQRKSAIAALQKAGFVKAVDEFGDQTLRVGTRRRDGHRCAAHCPGAELVDGESGPREKVVFGSNAGSLVGGALDDHRHEEQQAALAQARRRPRR